MSNSRLVVVSNRDTKIHYVGDWSMSDSSSFQTLGNFGPPLEDTLHTTTSNSSFSFSFSGTYISVLGLITESSSSQFTLECTVDGVTKSSSITAGENNVHLCTSNLPDGSHELVANISTQGSSFFLDNLQYAPSTHVPLNNATIIIPNIDPSITYSSGWTELNQFTTNMTEATNAFANVTFVGNRVQWFGIIPGSEPHAPASAEYSIDDGPLVSFTLPGLPSGASKSGDTFNIPFFTTDILEQGSHTLFVRYLGNDSVTPLTLNNLLITNASSPSSPPLSSSSSVPSSSTFVSSSSSPSSSALPSPPSTSSSPLETSSQNPIGAIAGGVVGGIAGIGLITALLVLYCRHLRSRVLRVASDGAVTPFLIDISQPEALATDESGLSNSFTTSQSGTATSMAYTQTPVSTTHRGLSAEWSAAVQRSNDSSPLIARYSNSNPVEEAPLVEVQHEDSGLRIVNPDMNNVIELPPIYTTI